MFFIIISPASVENIIVSEIGESFIHNTLGVEFLRQLRIDFWIPFFPKSNEIFTQTFIVPQLY